MIAQNEPHARMLLGGIWDENEERTPARPPREVDDINDIRDEALAAEREAQTAMLKANPVGRPGTYASPEQLEEFMARNEKYEKLKAHRQEIDRIVLSLGK